MYNIRLHKILNSLTHLPCGVEYACYLIENKMCAMSETSVFSKIFPDVAYVTIILFIISYYYYYLLNYLKRQTSVSFHDFLATTSVP